MHLFNENILDIEQKGEKWRNVYGLITDRKVYMFVVVFLNTFFKKMHQHMCEIYKRVFKYYLYVLYQMLMEIN